MSGALRAGLAALAALVLSGCVSISARADFGPRISPHVLDQIVPGETTRAEVLERLGPPAEFLRAEVSDALGDDGMRVSGAVRLGNRALDVLTWQHDRFRSFGRWWIVYLRVDSVARSDLLMIVFDERDLVREVSFRAADDG